VESVEGISELEVDGFKNRIAKFLQLAFVKVWLCALFMLCSSSVESALHASDVLYRDEQMRTPPHAHKPRWKKQASMQVVTSLGFETWIGWFSYLMDITIRLSVLWYLNLGLHCLRTQTSLISRQYQIAVQCLPVVQLTAQESHHAQWTLVLVIMRLYMRLGIRRAQTRMMSRRQLGHPYQRAHGQWVVASVVMNGMWPQLAHIRLVVLQVSPIAGDQAAQVTLDAWLLWWACIARALP